jgi:hypothetical protein
MLHARDPLRSQYLVSLNGMFIVDCCEERKREREEKGWRVVVLIHKENVREASRHCPKWLGCLKEKK